MMFLKSGFCTQIIVKNCENKLGEKKKEKKERKKERKKKLKLPINTVSIPNDVF